MTWIFTVGPFGTGFGLIEPKLAMWAVFILGSDQQKERRQNVKDEQVFRAWRRTVGRGLGNPDVNDDERQNHQQESKGLGPAWPGFRFAFLSAEWARNHFA
jgi:hypothetical protein